jgi:hypothetical protein
VYVATETFGNTLGLEESFIDIGNPKARCLADPSLEILS